jgi:hypothetical protein
VFVPGPDGVKSNRFWISLCFCQEHFHQSGSFLSSCYLCILAYATAEIGLSTCWPAIDRIPEHVAGKGLRAQCFSHLRREFWFDGVVAQIVMIKLTFKIRVSANGFHSTEQLRITAAGPFIVKPSAGPHIEAGVLPEVTWKPFYFFPKRREKRQNFDEGHGDGEQTQARQSNRI